MTSIAVNEEQPMKQGGVVKILTDHTSWSVQFRHEGSSNWSLAEAQTLGSRTFDPFNGFFRVSAASGGTFIEYTVTPII